MTESMKELSSIWDKRLANINKYAENYPDVPPTLWPTNWWQMPRLRRASVRC